VAAADNADSQMKPAAPNPMQLAEGAKYWSTQCQRCHNLRDPGEFPDETWDISVNHMRIRANIPMEQIEAIKAFLKASN
jgi:cytochrome c5